MIPVFVIGLKRHAERYEKTLDLLRQQGIEGQFWEGVDMILPGQDYQDQLRQNERVRKHYFRSSSITGVFSLGDLGCYLAHSRLLQHIFSQGWDRAVILECDATPQQDLQPLLTEIEILDSKYEMIYLYRGKKHEFFGFRKSPEHTFSTRNYSLHFSYGPIYSTVGYVITRSAIKKLLPKLMPIKMPIDALLGRFYYSGILSCVVEPFAIEHPDPEKDSISIIRNRYEDFDYQDQLPFGMSSIPFLRKAIEFIVFWALRIHTRVFGFLFLFRNGYFKR